MCVCLKGCKESFFKCRSIIGLDWCFLKGYYGGQLLFAIGRDPIDQMLPIAFALVEGETKESWKWFLEQLIADLGGPGLCLTYPFISDQQKVNSVIFINFHYLSISVLSLFSHLFNQH